MEAKKASTAADFGMPSRLIELPVPGPNGQLSVLIRAMTVREFMEWRVDTERAKSLPDNGERETASLDLIEKVARVVVVDPDLFGGGAWDMVHMKNREALVLAAVSLTMNGPGGADTVQSFPADSGGMAAGGGDQGGGEGAETAAAPGGGA